MTEYILPQNGLYYRTNDFQPQRQTLVFIHGLTGSSSAWEKYEKKFSNHYNLLTFDLRGHGMSKKYSKEQDYKVELFANDLRELINYLKIKQFVLISHSFGTIIALEFLRQYSPLVTKAIFLNPIYISRRVSIFKYYMYIIGSLISFVNLFRFNSKNGKHIDYSRFINTGDLDMKRLMEDIGNTSVRVYLYCLRQIYKYPHHAFWSNLAMKVLVLHGRKDIISPVKNAIKISHLIKDSKLIILNNANHITVINNFEEVSGTIEEFVSDS